MNKNKPLIIGISGKARSGKDSLASNLATGLFCRHFGEHIKYEQDINENIIVVDYNEPFIFAKNIEIYDEINKEENNFCQRVSCATPIKDFCVNTLGLKRNQVDGTNEEKNAPTHISWELASEDSRVKYGVKKYDKMSGRHVMQYVGTELMRKQLHNNIWVEALINSINNDEKYKNCKYVFVPDLRYENEVNAVIENGGLVIRLTRNPLNNNHDSEVALDGFDFKSLENKFTAKIGENDFVPQCHILDNLNLTFPMKNEIAGDLFTWIEEVRNFED